MSDDQADPILDACLDELLGGKRPPDLTARVLASWEASKPGVSQESAPPQIVPRDPPQLRRPGRRTMWRNLALGLGALTVTSAIGLLVLPLAFPEPDGTASVPEESTAPAELPDLVDRGEPVDEGERRNLEGGPLPDLHEIPFDGDIKVPLDESLAPPSFAKPLTDEDILTSIDKGIRAAWTRNRVTPAEKVGDREWCQRVYEKLLGRPVASHELERFLQVPAPDQRQQMLTWLFEEHGTRGEFSRHWAGIWTRLLLGKEKTRPRVRQVLKEYLEDAFRNGDSFDQIATRLLTATGSNQTEARSYDPAANFMFALFDSKRAIKTTDQLARVFLDQRLDCARCHDHPLDEHLTQRRFWELNAFLRQMKVKRSGRQRELVDEDFFGDRGGSGLDAPVFYGTPGEEVKAAYPELSGSDSLPHEGLVDVVNRRQLLAKLLIRSTHFGRAIVNQCWQEMLSHRLAPLQGQQGDPPQPEHSQILQRLGEQFAAHDYQLHKLLGWISLSRPFQQAAKAEGSAALVASSPSGQGTLFNEFYQRPSPRSATVVAALTERSKRTAAGPTGDLSTTARLNNPRPGTASNQGLIAADQARAVSAGIGSAGLDRDPDQIAQRIINSKLARKAKLEHLFWLLVGRNPTKQELRFINKPSKPDRGQVTLKEVWRALIANGETIR